MLKAEAEYDRQLTTGKASWEVAKLDGDEFTPGVFFVGAQLAARDCGPQWKEGSYVKAQVVRSAVRANPYGESAPGWKLFPTRLPDQLDREILAGRAVALGTGALAKNDPVRAEQARHPDLPRWQQVISGTAEIIVPANTEEFLLWDLDDYYCAYPLCEVSGGAGAKLAWSWAESLYLPKSDAKGRRGEFIGKTWFKALQKRSIPYAIRVRNNQFATLADGKRIKISALASALKNQKPRTWPNINLDGVRCR